VFHVKHKSDTKLAKWLENNRYSDPAFAKALAEADPAFPFSTRAVANWRRGTATPRARALAAMEKVSNGEITAAMFIEPFEVEAAHG
jgi:hypothetical protein